MVWLRWEHSCTAARGSRQYTSAISAVVYFHDGDVISNAHHIGLLRIQNERYKLFARSCLVTNISSSFQVFLVDWGLTERRVPELNVQIGCARQHKDVTGRSMEFYG